MPCTVRFLAWQKRCSHGSTQSSLGIKAPCELQGNVIVVIVVFVVFDAFDAFASRFE